MRRIKIDIPGYLTFAIKKGIGQVKKIMIQERYISHLVHGNPSPHLKNNIGNTTTDGTKNREVKQNLWDTVLFFQKGKFFELYENDATIGQQQFDLKMTDRTNMRY